jgi:excisionase family DNA binding protein
MIALDTAATRKRLYTPREAARHLDIGLTSLYGLLKRGELNAVKLGSLTKIPAGSLEDFIANLPARAR